MADEKPGTDWEAKKAAAGSKARNTPDRPYKANAEDLSPISEDDVKWGK